MDIDEICEHYAYALQESHLFQEFINELLGAWSDSAAHTLQTEVLDPHREDSERMLRAFEEQCKVFQAVNYQVRSLKEYDTKLRELQDDMDSEKKYAQGEMQDAVFWSDQFFDYKSIVTSQLSEIYRYIESARQYV